jgi:tetratricopeptide (TPR) repeat protein
VDSLRLLKQLQIPKVDSEGYRAEIYLNLGNIQKATGKIDEARLLMEKALKISKNCGKSKLTRLC